MKELSIEEKAKAYDEVREKIAIRFGSNVTEEIFSEYEESEDEKIRKSLIILLRHFCKGYRVPGLDFQVSFKDMLAWLEKQGKNNMGISEATKQKLEDNLNKALEKETPESFNEFLDEQNPAWSEEDEELLNTIINHFKVNVECTDDDDIIKWLKSLKGRYTWKPSDEQIKGIECAIKTLKYQLNAGDNRLNSLYDDLKKLREE